MGSFIDQIQNHWTVIVAIGSTVFFLYKIRAEETLRTRLKLIYECYNSFALVNDAVQDWAHPSSNNWEEFGQALGKLMPEALRSLHQASVLMRPETVRSLNKVFVLLSQLNGQYMVWQMRKEDQRNQLGNPAELVDAFENARKHLPKEIQKTVSDLLTDFQLLVNGPAKMLWWKISGQYYLWLRNKMNHGLTERFAEDRQAVIKSMK